MDLKDYAPKRKTVAIYALILAVACIVSFPLIYFSQTRIIPLTILLWAGFVYYPIQKALILTVVWLAFLAAMYVAASRIARGREWKVEVTKGIAAIALVCIVANYAVGAWNTAYGNSCEKESDCLEQCGKVLGRNYIYLEGGTESLCPTLEAQGARCIKGQCQVPKSG